MHDDNAGTGILVGLLVGAVAGLAIGMLMAPKPGRETREQLMQAINRGVERVRSRGESAMERMG